jgi:hypothetical protein
MQQSESANADTRIVLCAGQRDVADAFWNTLEKRLRKSGMSSCRIESGDADVAIFLISATGIVDDDPVPILVADVTGNSAPRKVLLQHSIDRDSKAVQRLDEVGAEVARRTGAIHVLPPTGDLTADESLRRQAKDVVRLLLADRVESSVRPPEKQEREIGRSKRSKKAAPPTGESPSTQHANSKEKRRGRNKSEGAARDAPQGAMASAKSPATARQKKRDLKPGGQGREDPPGDTEKAQSRAGTKADRKAARRAERKSAKKASSESGHVPEVPKDSRRRAEKKTSRPAERSRGNTDEDDSKTSRKAARKAERKAERNDSRDRHASKEERLNKKPKRKEKRPALRIAIHGLDDVTDALLRSALAAELEPSRIVVEPPIGDKAADIALVAFGQTSMNVEEIRKFAQVLTRERARLRIFIRGGFQKDASGSPEQDDANREISKLAGQLNAPLIDLGSKFHRYGMTAASADGALSEDGARLAAGFILAIAAANSPRLPIPRPHMAVPPDLMDASTHADSPSAVLESIGWNKPSVPKLLWAHMPKDGIRAFTDGRIELGPDVTVAIDVPIQWPTEFPDRQSELTLLGLEFLVGPLCYWYAKANGRSSESIAEIDAFLKQREIVASGFLARAGDIILDFLENFPASTPANAWTEQTVQRRSRALALFLLCCKMAQRRRVKFKEHVLGKTYAALLELIEIQRSEAFYRPVSLDGVDQDCLLIGLGLVLRGAGYGDRLLKDAIERLNRLQLEPGLTAEGVWVDGSISDHCTVLARLKGVLAEFEQQDAELLEPIAAAAKRMTLFAEAMLKPNGHPPAVDDSRQKSYAGHLVGARQALAGISGKSAKASAQQSRITETYVFRDAQYFVSHTARKNAEDSSLAIMRAEPARFNDRNPGGLMIGFAVGARDLLVRGAEGRRKDESAFFDPAPRNFYRINGSGVPRDCDLGMGFARLVKSWRGADWAAAKGIEALNPAASISRTAIHIKAVHALIVVDEIETAGESTVDLEQFWNMASGLTPMEGAESLRHFSAQDGCVTVAFDSRHHEIAIEQGTESALLSRKLRSTGTVLATLLQWGAEPIAASIKVERIDPAGWSVSAAGTGFARRYALSGDELSSEPQIAG